MLWEEGDGEKEKGRFEVASFPGSIAKNVGSEIRNLARYEVRRSIQKKMHIQMTFLML